PSQGRATLLGSIVTRRTTGEVGYLSYYFRPAMIDLNGIRLRNRVVTSSSLLGYGAPRGRVVLYGLSPFAQWVGLERFGAVTSRTLTLEPRAGHFSLREDWRLDEFPGLLKLYAQAL